MAGTIGHRERRDGPRPSPRGPDVILPRHVLRLLFPEPRRDAQGLLSAGAVRVMRQSVPTLESAPFLTCQQQFDVTRIPSASADTSSKGQAWPHRNRSRELSLADLHLLGNIVLAIVHLSPFVPAVPRSATRRLHIDRDVFDPGLWGRRRRGVWSGCSAKGVDHVRCDRSTVAGTGRNRERQQRRQSDA